MLARGLRGDAGRLIGGVMSWMVGVSAAVVTAVAGAAAAQTPAQPGPQAERTVEPQLVAPSGVGGCIYRNLSTDVSRDAVMAVLSHSDIGAVLRGPVGAAAPHCTKRPPSDPAVVGAVFSVYLRMVSAYFIGRQLNLPQRQLDTAWTSATPEEKAPFIASARSFLSPAASFAPANPEAVAAFERRLELGKSLDRKGSEALHMYFMATALNELAEANLADESRPSVGGS